MDPKDRILSEGWEEQYVDPNDKTSTAENTFAYVKRYADGRVEVQYYRRGQEGVRRTEVTIDKPTQTAFNADLARTTPSATSQATAARDTVTVNGKVMQWNPQTQRYDIEVGPASATSTESKPPTERINPADPSKRQVWNPKGGANGTGEWEESGTVAADPSKPPQERVNPSDPKRRQQWDPASNQWIDAGEMAQKPEEPAKPPQERANPEDPTKRQVWNPQANDGRGAWEDSGGVFQKPDMPKQLVDLPNGTKGQLIADPDNPGQWKAVPVAGTEKPKTPGVSTPDLANATLGKYTQKAKQQWDEKYVPLIDAGTITKEAALEQFTKVDRPLIQSQMDEEIAQLNAQQNIRSQDVSQRGQTLGEVGNQRSNMQGVYQTAVSHIMAHPEQYGKYSSGILNQVMDTYGSMQDKFGIPRGVPSEQQYTPQQSQVMGGAPGPSPIVFNINTGGAQPQSAPLAGVGAQMGLPGGMPETPGVMPPPQNPEQLLDEMRRNSPDQFWNQAIDRVHGDLQKAREQAAGGVAPGMSLSGGQLRAPGTSAGGPVGAGPVGQVG